MAKSYRVNLEKRKHDKKATTSKERSSLKASLNKGNFEDDQAFTTFKSMKNR